MIILRVRILVLDGGAVAWKEPGRPPQELSLQLPMVLPLQELIGGVPRVTK